MYSTRNKQDFWDDWFSKETDEAGAAFELAGLLLSLHTEILENEDVCLSGTRIWVFKRAVALQKQISNEFNMAQHLKIPSNYRGRVKLFLRRDIFAKLTSPDPFSSRRKGWHWLRGLYGNCGNIFSPRVGYHLVLRIPDDRVSNTAKELLKRENYAFSERSNGGANELMFRKQDLVVSFLNGIGLSDIALRIEEKSILRSVRERVNKLVNCDAANINKSVRAAEAQVEVAKKIKDSGLFHKLPSNYAALIENRLENPSATLADLGLSLSPPVSKSTVRYRWKKIEEFVSGNNVNEPYS